MSQRVSSRLLQGLDCLPTLPLDDVVDLMETGDLLFWRKKNIISRLGRGEYSHVEIVIKDEKDIWSMGMVWPRGRIIPLKRLVEEAPGKIDWFRTDPKGIYKIDRKKIAAAAMESIGEPYGLMKILYLILLRIPILWEFFTPVTDDGWTNPILGRICSEGVSNWLRAGGIDPVPHLADSLTEPADLARSLLFEPACSLIVHPSSRRMLWTARSS